MKRVSIAPELKSGRPGMNFHRNISALSYERLRRALTLFTLTTAIVVVCQMLVACSGADARANAQNAPAIATVTQDSAKAATPNTSGPLSYTLQRGDSTLLLA